MKCKQSTGLFWALAAALCAACAPASAGLDIDKAMWRLELNNDFGIHQGSRDRSGDYSLSAIAEYEVPATSRATLGLRLMPLFVYTQDDAREHRLLRGLFGGEKYEDGGTVWGGSVGIGGRLYQVKDEYRGWFLEAGVSVLLHSNEFNGNSSNINFLNQAGIGYQFKSDWHVQVHYRHISNASLTDRNSGANSLGIGIGYRF